MCFKMGMMNKNEIYSQINRGIYSGYKYAYYLVHKVISHLLSMLKTHAKHFASCFVWIGHKIQRKQYIKISGKPQRRISTSKHRHA